MRLLRFLSAACAAILIFPVSSIAEGIVRSTDPSPGVYIVMFDLAAPARTLSSDIARQHAVNPTAVYERAFKGFAFRGTEAKALAISKNPNVDFVYEATKVYAAASGTQTSPQWDLDRLDDYLGTDGTYSYGYSGAGVVAYVIDSGINVTPGLPAARIRSNVSFVPGDINPFDCLGHGTYVAETLGGMNYGVAKDVTFVNYRVLDCQNGFSDDAIVANAIDTAISDHQSHAGQSSVMNLSLSTNDRISTILDSAVGRAVSAGITVVMSAGNITSLAPSQDSCVESPGHLGYSTSPNGMITVAATDSGDSIWVNSKRGACIDIFAPGAGLCWYGHCDSGTSFAAPHVAGVAAIHLERKAAWDPLYRTPSEVENGIKGVAWTNIVQGVPAPNLFLYSGFAKQRPCCSF
jgi:subtilisin family serine protease